jgi:hypothetical protein
MTALAAGTADPRDDIANDDDVAALAKRHRISAAIVREIMRRAGTTNRSVIEREITKGKARR